MTHRLAPQSHKDPISYGFKLTQWKKPRYKSSKGAGQVQRVLGAGQPERQLRMKVFTADIHLLCAQHLIQLRVDVPQYIILSYSLSNCVNLVLYILREIMESHPRLIVPLHIETVSFK